MGLEPFLRDVHAVAFGEPIERLSVDSPESDGTSGELHLAEGLRRSEKAVAVDHALRPIGFHPLRPSQPDREPGKYSVQIFRYMTDLPEIPQVASVTESAGNNVVLRRSMRLVAFNQAEINGKGTVTVHLDKTIWGGYLELTASGGHAEIVNVSVKFPDGSNEILGACASDGSASTGTRYFFYLPKGDYMFYADGIDHYFALACIYNK